MARFRDLSGLLVVGIGLNEHRPSWPKGEPEARFEPNSYSYFRSSRSCHNATRAIHVTYLSTEKPEYVIDADARKFMIELVTRRFPMDLILLSW